MQPLSTYIQHPELLDAEAVKDLQSLLEQHPAFQTARLLMLRGLFQLQDERFGLELRKAAISMPDRRRLFELFEGNHFLSGDPSTASPVAKEASPDLPATDRTLSLIDSFLQQRPETTTTRRMHPADATVDYTSYLLQLDDAVVDDEAPREPLDTKPAAEVTAPTEPSIGSETLKAVKARENVLQLSPAQAVPANGDAEADDEVVDEHEMEPSEAYFTETLARIYIKQGKYAKAIEIIRRISLLYPQKNRYFADQIRFLEKILINERNQNRE